MPMIGSRLVFRRCLYTLEYPVYPIMHVEIKVIHGTLYMYVYCSQMHAVSTAVGLSLVLYLN